MYKFTNLTKVNGINYKNLESARQINIAGP